MLSVTEIYNKYNTDKNSTFHNYGRQYENLFREYRDKPVSILEIGVFQGESIKAWKELFKNYTKIVGLDINPECKQHEEKENNVFIEIIDASNQDNINFITQKYGTFDIILDDGSHTNEHVINSFELLYPHLNNNGLYIVEDTITYKSPGHINNNYPNHLDYFAKYTYFLNQWCYDSTENGAIKDHCIDPFKIMKKTNNIFEQSIDKIEFGCSYIAIFKQIREHWIPK